MIEIITTKAAKANPAPAPKAAKVPPVEQNGIKAPRAGGLCAQAWDMFDALGKKGEVTLAAARIEARTRKLNEGNVTTEIGRWRKFHGIAKPAKAAA